MNNNGIFRGNSVLKYAPEKSVVQLTYGDSIRLSADQFRRLAAAVFEELDQKFR